MLKVHRPGDILLKVSTVNRSKKSESEALRSYEVVIFSGLEDREDCSRVNTF